MAVNIINSLWKFIFIPGDSGKKRIKDPEGVIKIICIRCGAIFIRHKKPYTRRSNEKLCPRCKEESLLRRKKVETNEIIVSCK